MRRLLIACLLLAGCSGAAEPGPPPEAERLWPAPERYEVDAKYAANRLSGRLRLTLRNTGPASLTEIWMRTWPNGYASCARPLAEIRPSAGIRARCTAHRIGLDPALPRGERRTVALTFSVDVPRGADRFGRTDDVAYLGNAIPTLAVADADGWRLPPYFDQGEAWFALAADWKVRLDAAEKTVAATGPETAPGVHEARRARDFAIVVGDLRRTERRVGDITVRHFALPRQPRAQVRRALDAAEASLRYFQRWYGPYGRPELDLVQGPAEVAFRGIAMEYPELVLTPPAGAAVAHEIAHQWWAFIMGNDPYEEPFLDEGFAEYSAARMPRSVTGGDRLGRCRAPERPPTPALTSRVPELRAAGRRAYVRTVYVRTACFLRRLERELGQPAFDAMLRDLVARHRDRTWTRADLIGAIEQTARDPVAITRFLQREGVTRPVG